MKRYFLIAVGVAILLALTISNQPLKAQIYGDFDTVKVLMNTYVPLTSPNVVPPGTFMKPSAPDLIPTIPDRDDGYALAPLGFTFEFNGEPYSSVWICVNGFITFSKPIYIPANNPNGLFYYGASFPNNVIAPFWGDHYLISAADNSGAPPDNRYLQSEISYKTEGIAPNRVFTVQWKNLNINMQAEVPAHIPGNRPVQRQSIGNFQCKLYECPKDYSRQGNIEYCYGQVGGNTSSTMTLIVTRDASIGIKGESNVRGSFTDFMNGLVNDQDWTTSDDRFYRLDSSRISIRKTNDWQPSGGTDRRIRFNALVKYQEESWGDGDADISKAKGNKHQDYFNDQTRYVTVNDARVIMRAIVLNKQLDSTRLRNGYHADVNHNGRYYYRDAGVIRNYNNTADSLDPYTGDPVHRMLKYDLKWKNMYYGDSLSTIILGNDASSGTIVPSGITSIKQVFYQANEFDAAEILAYMSARIPSLPYLIDSIIKTGKYSPEKDYANTLVAGAAYKLSENLYKLPLYLNGYSDGPLSVKFNSDAEISDISSTKEDGNTFITDFSSHIGIIAGSGTYDGSSPICYLTVKSDKPEFNISNIVFNEKEAGNIQIRLSNIEDTKDGSNIMQIGPNPFVSDANVSLNISNDGYYTLSVYDLLGNRVRALFSGDLKSGQYNYVWNGLNDAGKFMNNGLYVIKLTSDNLSVSQKILLSK